MFNRKTLYQPLSSVEKKGVRFNPYATLRTVPRLVYRKRQQLLNPPNNIINFMEGTLEGNVRTLNPPNTVINPMKGIFPPYNPREKSKPFYSRIISEVNNPLKHTSNYNSQRRIFLRNRNQPKINSQSSGSYDQLNYVPLYRNGKEEENEEEEEEHQPVQEIYFPNNPNGAMSHERFNRMQMQRMPISGTNRIKKLIELSSQNQKGGNKKNGKSGKSKKNKKSGKSNQNSENLFSNNYGVSTSRRIKKIPPFHNLFGYASTENYEQNMSAISPYVPPSYSESYNHELYGNNLLSRFLQNLPPSNAAAAATAPEYIHPYNRRPHGLNQRAWFNMSEKAKNHTKKSVSIAPKSQKRTLPKYKSTGRYRMEPNEAAMHGINGYLFENNVNEYSNPINTAYLYNEEEINTKGGKKIQKVKKSKKAEKSKKTQTVKKLKK
jgi:hypothetical protein